MLVTVKGWREEGFEAMLKDRPQIGTAPLAYLGCYRSPLVTAQPPGRCVWLNIRARKDRYGV